MTATMEPSVKRPPTQEGAVPDPIALPPDWKRRLSLGLDRAARAGRWDRALSIVGVAHLAVFLVLHQLYLRDDATAWKHVGLWAIDMLGALAVFRLVAGPGWAWSAPLAGVLLRVWGTFFILAFNAASLNQLMGATPSWYKLGWGILSTYGFMVMTFLASPWFFVAAVWMFLTDLLMAAWPDWQFVIYGASWCLCLQAIALVLRVRWARLPGN